MIEKLHVDGGFNVDISVSKTQVKLIFDENLNSADVDIIANGIDWQLLNTLGVVLIELSAKVQKGKVIID